MNRIHNWVPAIEAPASQDGHEVILKTSKDTEMPSMINMGETVEATVDSAGIPTKIKPTKR